MGQHVYARKPPLEKGYTGPWEIVQVRGGGSSYKLKHLRQRRWISRRAEHLKIAFVRPAHLKSKRTPQNINLAPDTTLTTALDAQKYSPSDTESGDELPPRDLPLSPPNSNDGLGEEIVNTSNTGVFLEDNNSHSAGSSVLNQAESGTDSTTSNENALCINQQVYEGLGNKTGCTHPEPVRSITPIQAPTVQRRLRTHLELINKLVKVILHRVPPNNCHLPDVDDHLTDSGTGYVEMTRG